MSKLLAVGLCLVGVTSAMAQVWSEDFNGAFPPTGWTVIDNTGNGDWQLNTFFGDDNWTGGDGTCADVNTDYYGGAHNPIVDTELISPEFVVPTGATLEFDTNYQTYIGGDYADTDISLDGGASWINVLSWHGTADEQGTWHGAGVHIVTDISAYAGETAQLRFYHYEANWEWYWQVDNVAVTPEPCALLLLGVGGLAVGRYRRR